MTSEPSISSQVLRSLRQITRAMDIRSRQLGKTVGLTVPQLIVLKEVADAVQSPIGQIAKRVSLSQATVTAIVDRLEQRGLAERHRALNDRRKVMIRLTEEGATILQKSPTILQEQFLEAFDKLQAWEQTMMLATLQRVAAMMGAQTIPALPMLTAEQLPEVAEHIEIAVNAEVAER